MLRQELLIRCAPMLLLGLGSGQPAAAADEAVHTLSALLDGKGFVRISAGEFLMGSREGNPDEQPVHRVRISRDFEIGRFEVTQAQWETVMRNPHAPPAGAEREEVNPSHFKDPARPVENVSWDAVQQFIQRLNKRDPDHVYRLPTEAEWEYAARAGATDHTPAEVTQLAWHEANSAGGTQPVGQKRPNAWGLHDVYGNVREWVQDWYGPDHYGNSPGVDPQGPEAGSYKVHRGGAWVSPPDQCRPAFRGFDFPNPGQYSIGFRLVRTAK